MRYLWLVRVQGLTAWACVSNAPGYIVHKKSQFFSATSISSRTVAMYYSPCVYYLKGEREKKTGWRKLVFCCAFFFFLPVNLFIVHVNNAAFLVEKGFRFFWFLYLHGSESNCIYLALLHIIHIIYILNIYIYINMRYTWRPIWEIGNIYVKRKGGKKTAGGERIAITKAHRVSQSGDVCHSSGIVYIGSKKGTMTPGVCEPAVLCIKETSVQP